MATKKTRKLWLPKRWCLGIDPGFNGTALVLAADTEPVAAALNSLKSPRPTHERLERLAAWMQEKVQAWVDEYEIEVLHVVIELPFLNAEERGVTSLMSQCQMLGVYKSVFYRIENCEVWLGEVSNTTPKKIFTGKGQASKINMITRSAWAYRTDLDIDTVRQHLADAQGIAMCYPEMYQLRSIPPKPSTYEDGRIGEGPQWQRRKKA